MSTPVASVNIDESIVRTIVEKEIKSAIAIQLGKAPNLIENVVALAMRQRVSENGKVSDYSYENKHDFVDVLCRNAIKEVAVQAVKEFVEEKRPEIMKAVKSTLQKQQSEMTKTFIDQIQKALAANFYISCNLAIKENK